MRFLFLSVLMLSVFNHAQAQPTAQCKNATVYLDAAGQGQLLPSVIDNGSIGGVQWSINGAPVWNFGCAQLGTNVLQLTVTDAQGLQSSCSSTVNVADSSAPVLQCVNSVTLYLNASGTATATPAMFLLGAWDNCSIASYSINNQASFACTSAHLGLNSVLIRGTDASGNTGHCASALLVADTFPVPCTNPDTVAPQARCRNSVVSLPQSGSLVLTPQMLDDGSSDNCTLSALLVSGQPSLVLNCNHLGANHLTLTALDAAGNSSQCLSVITLVDNISPTLVCQNSTIYLSALGLTSVQPQQIVSFASDACTLGNWRINGQPNLQLNCGNLGVQVVSIQVSDAAGNTSSCSAALTLADSTAPQVHCASNPIRYLDAAGLVFLSALELNEGSWDNCFLDSIWLADEWLDCAQVSSAWVTLYAKDASGNIGSCQTELTVLDTLPPSVVCPSTLTIHLDSSGTALLAAADVPLWSADNCGIAALAINGQSSLLLSCVDLGVGPYLLTVWDFSGNAGTCSSDITVPDTLGLCPVIGQVLVQQASDCSGQSCTGVVQVQAWGGAAPYVYLWSDGGLGAQRSGLCPGVYALTISDANQDTAVISGLSIGYEQGCVWPGDTDDDGRVSNLDVLPIALAFGDIGPARPGATTLWQGQPAPDWNTALPGLPDHKHADCNGDGMIGQADLSAVAANYGSSYPRTGTGLSVSGPLPLIAGSLSTPDNARIGLPLRLGTPQIVADSVYALAFSILYNPNYVVAGSGGLELDGSWLGSDLLSLHYEHSQAGRLDAVVARKDRQPVSGLGQFATFYITIIEDVLRRSGDGGPTDSVVCMPIEIVDVRLINHQNTVKGTTQFPGEVCIQRFTGLEQTAPSTAQASLRPNPVNASASCLVQCPQGIEQLWLCDMLGRRLWQVQANGAKEYLISTQNLRPGLYSLRLTDSQGKETTLSLMVNG